MSSFLSVAPTLLVIGVVMAIILFTIFWRASTRDVKNFIDEMEPKLNRGQGSIYDQQLSNIEVRRQIEEILKKSHMPVQKNMLAAYRYALLREFMELDKQKSQI